MQLRAGESLSIRAAAKQQMHASHGGDNHAGSESSVRSAAYADIIHRDPSWVLIALNKSRIGGQPPVYQYL